MSSIGLSACFFKPHNNTFSRVLSQRNTTYAKISDVSSCFTGYLASVVESGWARHFLPLFPTFVSQFCQFALFYNKCFSSHIYM